MISKLLNSFLFGFAFWFDPPSFDGKFVFNHTLQQLIFMSVTISRIFSFKIRHDFFLISMAVSK